MITGGDRLWRQLEVCCLCNAQLLLLESGQLEVQPAIQWRS
jgi:hypothetical protein